MQKTLFLFVPATRLDRVPKARDSGADKIIIDLEDAVADDQKQDVRTALRAFDATAQHSYWLRINASHTAEYHLDIACIKQLNNLAGVLLPKCQNALQVESLHHQINTPVIAMIETAVGIANIANIATSKGLWAMSFGRLDLMHELGVRLGSQASELIFDKIRADLLIHSVANSLNPPIETIFAEFDNEAGLRACVRHWSDFGFGGQLLIHPKQITTVRQVLKMGEDELAFAQAIYQKHQETGDTVFAIDGKMVDLPLIHWANHLLKTAKN
ncbi:HpcH/HpaI aldolase/citrate lyase family protein [Moraxella catarrhalis]|uniref:Citrate lyase beta chain n=1 Tax=Moraxella catarrhalis TaxID=480 RepID=A0A198UMV6_MORCA|nr:CoA ester lyase [Moraxella catarrhalis]OAU96572.1 Citrate lyase beta chain [Moraxella catarrhalis]OAU99033.1 Citrate lyase beta chain [Moraxella catarrhalis]OAU99048.1 Citrate lyase beta chain [Moraxella catarrhalis]